MLSGTQNRTGQSGRRALNKRTALILLSVAAAFFFGIILKYLFFGK